MTTHGIPATGRKLLVAATAAAVLSGCAASVGAPPGRDLRSSLPDVVAGVVPAVVGISTRHIERDQFNRPVASRGLGSGVVIDSRGHVLTNSHVVEGAQDIKVTLPDGRTFRAVLAGADAVTDLALLRLETSGLPVARLGASARLRVGETVIAIGNPLWIEGGPTVTVGVVSGLGRSMEQPGLPMLHGLIQTDAAINAGNSGGPLVNLGGEVVGINTAVIASAHGIGFAIASDPARPVLAALMERGRVERASLALEAVSVTPQVAYANELPLERGVLVISVDPAGAGEAAGVREGDIITALDGRPIENLHDLHEALAAHRAGDTVSLVVQRDRSRVALRAVLGGEP